MINASAIIGWDIGGANLKAVLINVQGDAIEVFQLPCPLWRGLDALEKAVDQILSHINVEVHQHAITMTGELVDLFAHRHKGVVSIANLMQQKLAGDLSFYAGPLGFVAFNSVPEQSRYIASANWHASARYAAQVFSQGLLLDIGSTTSDFVRLFDGNLHSMGLTDAERMRENTLVYTGVVRTPLMALASRIAFEGALSNVAAEHFATTADVYRLTGDLQLEDDVSDTADGASKSLLDSARRIARMIGHDVEDAGMSAWFRLAQSFKLIQLGLLQEAAEAHFSEASFSDEAPLIGVGAGRFLVKILGERMQRPYVDISSAISAQTAAQQYMAGVCLPAYAVAYLLAKKIC
jgi:(4-(4-[2-(gamma-L-glutamylamino)ethyl]phenoxymethyl)furan-2-yl)methanamine synthase